MFFGFLKAVFSAAELALYFVPLLQQRVVLPDPGAPSGIVYEYQGRSILSVLSAMGWDTVLVLGMTAAVVSVILAVLSMVFRSSKTVKTAGTIVFAGSLLVLLGLYLFAAKSLPK